MNFSSTNFPSGRLLEMLSESARRGSGLHRQFLQARLDGLQAMRALIEMQIGSRALQSNGVLTGSGALPGNALQQDVRPALFDSRHLDEFGTGRISACFGPAFSRYDGMRIPRIPNGDLKMMSRITAITGIPGSFNAPASITAEYDVPAQAWYLHDAACPVIPSSLWMEIALQPCGFLSAYLDTYALVPHGAFFFRNLDGSLRMLANIDLRGKTITTQARLVSSVISGGTVIQKYAFELACAGQPLCAGESIFGYFSAETMAAQVGLDGGQAVSPALRADPGLAQRAVRADLHSFSQAGSIRPRPAGDRLRFLDEITLVREGGRYGKGYVYAARPVDPRDWYFPCHFYQDPVMPGSLGVEAILEAMQGFALAAGLGRGLRSPRFGPVPGAPPMSWRYRGQITQQHKLMEVEVHLSQIEQHAGRIDLLGDASLWVDGLRIYEVKNATVGILEES